MCKRFYLKKNAKNRNYGTSLHSQLWCCMNTQEFCRANKEFQNYVICDLNIEKTEYIQEEERKIHTNAERIPF